MKAYGAKMRIYFLGVAGTAMGNAALMMHDLGHEVIGSDQAVYPPMSDMLREANVETLEGYSAARLKRLNPDLVVIGNAFSRGNEEVEFLLNDRSIPFASLPETLNRFALTGRRTVVVTGTHGKTTTTALAAYLLESAGAVPGYLIGGAPIDPKRGWRVGDLTDPFVIEGDEYDSAFFDKRSKFIHYAPHIAIINNLEFDHADIFRDLEDVKRSFEHFTRIVPSDGHILLNGDDANALSLLPIPWTRVTQVGLSKSCDLRIENYETTATGSRFDLRWKGAPWIEVEWSLSGLFNARNAAMACLATAFSLDNSGDPTGYKAEGLSDFRGVMRRQQTRHESGNWMVLEDFAHHPTAIREILEALKERYPNHSMVTAFEPRSNTSRLEIMHEPLVEALSIADAVVVGAAKASQEESIKLLNTERLAESLRERSMVAVAGASNDDALVQLTKRCEECDGPTLVVFLTNGSFGGIIDRFVESLD